MYAVGQGIDGNHQILRPDISQHGRIVTDSQTEMRLVGEMLREPVYKFQFQSNLPAKFTRPIVQRLSIIAERWTGRGPRCLQLGVEGV